MKQPKYSKDPKVVNTSKETGKAPLKQEKETENKPSLVQRFPKSVLATKVFVILAIVIGIVKYTDNQTTFLPDRTYRDLYLVESFKDLAKKDTIDICLFGNSHIGHGISANILTNSLGATCFNFFQSRTDLEDTYFTLKNFYTQSELKVAVIETYVMTDQKNKAFDEIGGKTKSRHTRIWENEIKIEAMFKTLDIEQYPSIWSNTIRNHNYIFRDTAQIRKNKQQLYNPPKGVYLGSSAISKPGINDSLDAIYDTLGPISDGALVGYDEYDQEYIKKITDLCKAHNTKLVFVTLPEYHRNIKNYKQWHDVVASLIQPTGAPWLDMQLNYDTTAIKREYFERKRDLNQHIVESGIPYMSTRLALFMKDSCDLGLTNRANNKNWRKMFYGSEGYFFNYRPEDNDTINVNLKTENTIGSLKVNNAFYINRGKTNHLFVKFEKDNFPKDKDSLKVQIKGIYKNNEVITVIRINKLDNYLPVNYHIYHVGVIKDFKPTEIIAVKE